MASAIQKHRHQRLATLSSSDNGLSRGGRTNQGSLLIDATCVPADVRYPTDLSLLNEARGTTEKLIDAMHEQGRDRYGKKPRTHRRKARKQFLAVRSRRLLRSTSKSGLASAKSGK